MYMRIILLLLVTSFFINKAKADEGMWLPLLLGEETYKQMTKKGLKLTKEQLFSINKNSIKDGIVNFSGGCTGAVVSNTGLIMTNYHCGFGNIAGLSTVQNNYLKNGFFSTGVANELAAPGLSVQFLINIKDVTAQIEEKLKGLTGIDRRKKLLESATEINKLNSDAQNFIEARVASFFKGNQYLLFVYQRYNDVRLVAAPSESMGKYGGDTDNWMWPRHTCDFSVWRVYTSTTGAPARYAANNVPLKSKYSFALNTSGVKENDYNMVMGYPDATNRYEVSQGVLLQREITNPIYVKCRDLRMKIMRSRMDFDNSIQLKLVGRYAELSNYHKYYDIETKQLYKRQVVERKQKLEEDFEKWATGKKEYENIFTDYEVNYAVWKKYEKLRVFMNQGINGCNPMSFGGQLVPIADLLRKGTDADVNLVRLSIPTLSKNRTTAIAATDLEVEVNLLALMLYNFYTDIDSKQHPPRFFDTQVSKFGRLNELATYKKFATNLFDQSLLINDNLWNSFVNSPSLELLTADPGYQMAFAFSDNWNTNYKPIYDGFLAKNTELGKLYIKALKEKNNKQTFYADANGTMRLTYGNVKGYSSKMGMQLDYLTTAEGLLEKYVPNSEEFDMPAKAITLMRNKNYGNYADAQRKDLVTCFINNCDITGGNSGSPVLNGRGEILGFAFDGNSESMDQKFNYDETQARCIAVDIRFILWTIEKVGEAKNIINEFKLVK
jgi:hypothetical protein